MEKGSEGKVAGPCFNISRYFSLLSFLFSLSLLLTTRRFSSKESTEHVMQVTIGACQCSIPEIPVIERYRRFSLPSKNRPDYVMRVVTPTVASSDKDSRSEEKLGSSMWNLGDPFHFLGVARELRTGRSLFSC